MKNSIILLLLVFLFQVSCKKKEDMSSFITMNTKIEESIEINSIANSTLLDVIYSKAKSDDTFISYKENADKVHEISAIFSKYLSDLKSVIKEKNSTKFVDEYFFNGGNIAKGGDELLNYIENYKSSLISTIALSNPDIAGMIKSTFDIGSIEDRKGKQTNWLTLNYKGFPAISSVIKLSEMQANVKQIEKSFHESILNVKLKKSEIDNNDSLFKKDPVATNTVTKKTVSKVEKPKVEVKKVTPKKEVKKVVVVPKKTATIHVVKKKETLYLISKKYGLTTVALKKMNGLTNNNLVIGQKLKIKK